MEESPLEETAYTLWMREMSKGVVQIHSELVALTKAVDGLTVETRANHEAGKATAEALTAVLQAEMARQEQEDEAIERRQQWLQRVFSSQPGQLLMLGLVYFALHQFGSTVWPAALAAATGGS